MTSQEAPTDENPKANPILGCGCLLVIILIIGSLAVSCFGGSDGPAEQPLPAAAPITTRSAPPTTTTSAPTSSYAEPVPAQPVRDRDCNAFSTQAEAQAALLPGDPERLDPDSDGLACENYFANLNQPNNSAPDPPASSNDDDNSSGGTRPRSGNSGHPCLPGERDGDNDGYCGEG